MSLSKREFLREAYAVIDEFSRYTKESKWNLRRQFRKRKRPAQEVVLKELRKRLDQFKAMRTPYYKEMREQAKHNPYVPEQPREGKCKKDGKSCQRGSLCQARQGQGGPREE